MLLPYTITGFASAGAVAFALLALNAYTKGMARLKGFLLALLLAPAAVAAPSEYQHCSQMAASKPQQALEIAEQWIQQSPSSPAYHCRAMALFSLGRYQQAAGALAMLQQRLRSENPVLWSHVVRQQARSWVLARDNARAIKALTSGIVSVCDAALETPLQGKLCAELLHDRSKLHASGGRDLFALQDLDQALSLSPKTPQLLLARAELFASQGERDLAARDLNTLRALHPNYPGLARAQSALSASE